nr:hypothetical protein [Polyangiaceae bacterium]
AELDAIAVSLGADELRVLVFVAGRLAHGRECYGELDVATDGRDFRQERAEELADALVYSACAELRRVCR